MTTTRDLDVGAHRHVLRDLGVVERMFHLVSKRTNVHFCIVGEVRGPLDSAEVRAAFESVRCRHPLLSARIDEGPSGAPAICPSDLPTDVRFLAMPSHGWTSLVARELARPFPDAYGPLLRAHVLQAPHGATIVLTFNHTLADGLAGVRVLRDLLERLAGRQRQSTGVPASLDSFAEVALGKTEIDNPPPAPSAAQAPSDENPVASDTVPRVSTIAFSAHETQELLRAGRNAGATLHGALCAGLASAARRPSADAYGILHPMDLRAAVSAPEDVCSLLVTAVPTCLANGPDANFWTVARNVSHDLASARQPNALREGLAMLAALIPPDADADGAFAVMKERFAVDALVTNLGALKIEGHFGPLTLDAVWGPFAWPSQYGVPFIGAATFDGGLRIVETATPDHPSVLEALKSRLLDAIGLGMHA